MLNFILKNKRQPTLDPPPALAKSRPGIKSKQAARNRRTPSFADYPLGLSKPVRL
jgi:hypothetical protein